MTEKKSKTMFNNKNVCHTHLSYFLTLFLCRHLLHTLTFFCHTLSSVLGSLSKMLFYIALNIQKIKIRNALFWGVGGKSGD